MGRNLESNRRGYNTRCKLFNSVISEEDERIIKRDYDKPIVFYAKDAMDFELTRDEFGAMHRQIQTGVIETMDLKESQINVSDTVEYQNKRYNVETVRHISNNQQSEVRLRVATKTIIKLGAVVGG